MQHPPDLAGPTPERISKSDGCFNLTGRSRSQRRFSMYDDALGRAWITRRISGEEYAALGRYAYHWAAGGLRGTLNSIDLDRILAHNPADMTGLAKTERQVDHRAAYHAARIHIGTRPAFVADRVACFDIRLAQIGEMLGYRSRAHGLIKAREILSDAGYRLGRFFRDLDRR